jgi:hypothetical protein
MFVGLALAALVQSVEDGPAITWNTPANSAWKSIPSNDDATVPFSISWAEQTADPDTKIEFQVDSTDDNAPWQNLADFGTFGW